MTAGLKYCLYCNSSMSMAWDGAHNYRLGICEDCEKRGVRRCRVCRHVYNPTKGEQCSC